MKNLLYKLLTQFGFIIHGRWQYAVVVVSRSVGTFGAEIFPDTFSLAMAHEAFNAETLNLNNK